jgi:hypothetical protein
MSDRFDDEIRDALRAEADGVHADDELLERIRAARPTRQAWSRRLPLLLAAAAVVLVVGLAVALDRDDREQTVDVVDDPDRPDVPGDLSARFATPEDVCPAVGVAVYLDPSIAVDDRDAIDARLTQDERLASVRYVSEEDAFASLLTVSDGVVADDVPSYFLAVMQPAADDLALRSEVADLPGVVGITSTTCDPADGEAPQPPPESIVAVTDDGRLVVLRTSDGAEVSELADLGSGEASEDDPAPVSITGVALRPGTTEVYFETCCEPAAGQIFKVDLATPGAEPVSVALGYGMDISGDGRRIAFVSGPVVTVTELDTGEIVRTAESGDGSHEWVQAALNQDGSVLAIERALERDDAGQIVRSDARTTSLVDGAYEEHDVDQGRFMPLFVGGTSLASAPGPGERLKDANLDESGGWILVVTEGGRLVARGEGERLIADGPFLAADW